MQTDAHIIEQVQKEVATKDEILAPKPESGAVATTVGTTPVLSKPS